MSEFDKVSFLKTCMQESNVRIDFGKVGEVLDLKKGTASMRYQRMMKAGSKTATTPQNLQYLQTCLRVSDVKLDFKKIGEKLGLKPGTAAMRYKRLMAKAAAPSPSAAASASANSSATEATPTKKRSHPIAAAPMPSKKTRTGYFSDDDEEVKVDVKVKRGDATRGLGRGAGGYVKGEEDDDEGEDEGEDAYPFANAAADAFIKAEKAKSAAKANVNGKAQIKKAKANVNSNVILLSDSESDDSDDLATRARAIRSHSLTPGASDIEEEKKKEEVQTQHEFKGEVNDEQFDEDEDFMDAREFPHEDGMGHGYSQIPADYGVEEETLNEFEV